jgi:hypothetical protein
MFLRNIVSLSMHCMTDLGGQNKNYAFARMHLAMIYWPFEKQSIFLPYKGDGNFIIISHVSKSLYNVHDIADQQVDCDSSTGR